MESESVSESSCDSDDRNYGANTLMTRVKNATSKIKQEFKVNLRETTQDNMVTLKEIKRNPGKYYVFLTKGDRLDFLDTHSRRKFVKKAVDDSVLKSSGAYKSQAIQNLELKPKDKIDRLRRGLKRSSTFTTSNVKSYISPNGFKNAVDRMGLELGNPWISLSKHSPLSTRYAEAQKFDEDNPPKLIPDYNYTPRKRTLFTAIKEKKLAKGWLVFWEKDGEEFEGEVSKHKSINGKFLKIEITSESLKKPIKLKVNCKTGEIFDVKGEEVADAKAHFLTRRPTEKGRPKHRLIGMKTVFAFEANEYEKMKKVDVEDYRNRGVVKGRCAVERENYEVILPLSIPRKYVAGRLPHIYPNLAKASEQVYGLTDYARSRPRKEHGDLTLNFKASNMSPVIEQLEYKLALRFAKKQNKDATLLWVDKAGTYRKIRTEREI